MSTNEKLFEPEGRPTRLPGETYAQWQARLEAWRRGVVGDEAELSRTLLAPSVGIPPASPRFAPSPTGERLGDFRVTGTADLPAPRITRPAGASPAAPPSSGPSVPAWARPAMGGALPPGLRPPPTAEEEQSSGRRRWVLEVTGFDLAWGTPPDVEGLRWSPERFLYEPTADAQSVPYRGPASRGFYRQAYSNPTLGPGAWGWRWVEARTTRPDPAYPYRVVGRGEASALDLEVNNVRLYRRAPEAEGARTIDVGTLPTGRVPLPSPAPAIVRRPRMTDFAWIPQQDLPIGCPYPHAYLPVPRQDYVSGRWLLPDYAPSIPLPPPYDQTPWQCGSPAIAESKKGRGGPDAPPLSQQIIRRQDAPPPSGAPTDDSTRAGSRLDVGLPPPTGSAAPAEEEAAPETPDVAAAIQAARALDDQRDKLERKLEDTSLSDPQRAALRVELEKVKQAGKQAHERVSDAISAAEGSGRYAKPRGASPGIPPPTVVAAPEDASEPVRAKPRTRPCKRIGPDGERRIPDGSLPSDGDPAQDSRMDDVLKGIQGTDHTRSVGLSGAKGKHVQTGFGPSISENWTESEWKLQEPAISGVTPAQNKGLRVLWGHGVMSGRSGGSGRGVEAPVKHGLTGIWFGADSDSKRDIAFVQYVRPSLQGTVGRRKVGEEFARPMQGDGWRLDLTDMKRREVRSEGKSDGWYETQAARDGMAMMFDIPGLAVFADETWGSAGPSRLLDKFHSTFFEGQSPSEWDAWRSQVLKDWGSGGGSSKGVLYTLDFATYVIDRSETEDCTRRSAGYFVWRVTVYVGPDVEGGFQAELAEPPEWVDVDESGRETYTNFGRR